MSVEEAPIAYLTKKTEFEQEMEGREDSRCVGCDEGNKHGNDSSLRVDSTISKRKRSFHRIENKIVGVNKMKNGKYNARIKHPVSKKDLWLGSFLSEEEAEKVYLAKKRELQNEVKGKKAIQGVVFDEGVKKVVDQCLGDNDSEPCLENYDSGLHAVSGRVMSETKVVGVKKMKSGKYAARIRHPTNRKDIWLGTFRSHEEAVMAYMAKKNEWEKGSESSEEGVEWVVCKDNGIKGTDQLVSMDFESNASNGEYESGEHESGMEKLLIQRNEELVKRLQGTEGIRRVVSEHNVVGKSNDQLSHEPCLDDQESATLIDPLDDQESATLIDPLNGESNARMEDILIQKNGGSDISTDSGVRSESDPEILLKTESGVPIMDSHGFLLGDWSWIDDLSLPDP